MPVVSGGASQPPQVSWPVGQLEVLHGLSVENLILELTGLSRETLGGT